MVNLQPNILYGAASLVKDIDKKVMVSLRDGRILVGFLRSFDQFANIVLHRAVERIFVDNKYGDIDRGIFLIRGDNVIIVGELDTTVSVCDAMERVSPEEILSLQKEELMRREAADERKRKIMRERGIFSEMWQDESTF